MDESDGWMDGADGWSRGKESAALESEGLHGGEAAKWHRCDSSLLARLASALQWRWWGGPAGVRGADGQEGRKEQTEGREEATDERFSPVQEKFTQTRIRVVRLAAHWSPGATRLRLYSLFNLTKGQPVHQMSSSQEPVPAKIHIKERRKKTSRRS